MKVESTQFTQSDFDAFIEGYLVHERDHLTHRLRQVVEDTESFLPAIEARSNSVDEQWSSTETLAHMAVTAQFFGWLAHEVADQREIQGDILEMLKLRDVAGADASQKSPAELAAQLRETIERTISFMEGMPVDQLRNSFKYLSREMTAEDIVRVMLCGHLEEHVVQIRSAVGTS